MKVISYSIFRAPCEKFEFMAYLRGLYFNARMNRLIYPEWTTWVHAEESIVDQYKDYFDGLPIDLIHLHGSAPLCEAMLWRMKPIFDNGISHVICRDADAITTYREAQLVNIWEKSNKGVHAIIDNPAHDGLMGGMVGFKTDTIKKHFPSWADMIKGNNLSKRGSDQDLLNQKVRPKVLSEILCSQASGLTGISWPKVPGIDYKLWESNLTCRHIGSAGVVEMETLRFFKRFDKTDYSEFEKQHSDICYWAR